MTDWAVFAGDTEDEATITLPKFARKAVNREDSPTLATLQWKGGLGTEIKKQLLGSMIEPLRKTPLQLVQPQGLQAVGDDAFHAFLSAVDTESWWLGDIALLSSNGGSATLVKPDADGLFINVYSWGPDRVAANRKWLTSMSLMADGSGPPLTTDGCSPA